MEGTNVARSGGAAMRIAVAFLALLQLLLGAADEALASTVKSTARRSKAKASRAAQKRAKKPAPKVRRAPRAQDNLLAVPIDTAPAPAIEERDARMMRSVEGAIVNIIDSYIDRKETSRVKHVYLGKFPVTLYWTADEIDEGKGPRSVPITVIRRDGSRTRIRVSAEFKRRLDVEGTAMLKDGHVLNVTSSRGVYDDVTQVATLGYGSGGRKLVPYRSIAVNRFAGMKGLKVGDRVFIPQAVGMKLPSGTRHDGYFRVDDVGSGVKGIDIYTLTRADGIAIERMLANDKRRLPLYKVLAKSKSRSKASPDLAQLD
ncbi:MAG: hypothetical protein HYY25_03425 [Candidatus Wallbacteria bacterium]|nr:hypothetical protein [Candidatus Wallbacteria bacterium]